MNIEIRLINDNEFNEALNLIEKTFNKFVAPYYTKEGLICFKENYFNYEEMLRKFKNEKWEYIGAFDKEKLVGILTGNKRYIEMFFIDENYQHLGIGKKLFKQYISNKVEDIILYSSHDAVQFYEKLGFKKIENERSENGMLTTPMIYKTKEMMNSNNNASIKKH